MSETRYGFTYKLATVAVEQGKPLAVSHGVAGGPEHNYVTIPWNAVDEDPNDPLNTVSLNYGWSFLYGPTVGADIFAHVRVMKLQARCSTHLRLYIVEDGVRQSWVCESPEHPVLDKETHIAADGTITYTDTHIPGAWHVPPLAANQRLRLEVDYWNADEPLFQVGSIVGARVAGTYWRAS